MSVNRTKVVILLIAIILLGGAVLYTLFLLFAYAPEPEDAAYQLDKTFLLAHLEGATLKDEPMRWIIQKLNEAAAEYEANTRRLAPYALQFQQEDSSLIIFQKDLDGGIVDSIEVGFRQDRKYVLGEKTASWAASLRTIRRAGFSILRFKNNVKEWTFSIKNLQGGTP